MDEDWYGQPQNNVVPLPLRATPARLPEPGLIPPREWLYGTSLIRRFVTVLVAPGGTGKSIYALGRGMALASGKPIFGEAVHHRVNSWVMNLEDPLEETERRVAAMMIRHGLTRDDLEGRLFLNSGRDRRLTIATPSDYGEIIYPDKDACIDAMLAAKIGHIVVDPFVKSHGLEENSNPHMDAAATAWAEIGQVTGAAIDLIHHTRKGAPADIEAARGGKALTDAARVGQVMCAMTPEEAAELGIPEASRWQHVRLEDAKVNMSPRAATARWFRMEMVPLHNHTPEYPHGDNVAALAAWEPPNVWQSMPSDKINEALDRIDGGLPSGALYSASRRGRENTRWAGHVLVTMFGITEGQAAVVIAQWVKNGVLVEATFRDPEQRKDKTGVRVDDEKRPT